MHSYNIDFDRTDNKDSNHELISAKIKVNGPVPINVILQGDVDTSSIHLILKNFESRVLLSIPIKNDISQKSLLMAWVSLYFVKIHDF